LLITKSLLLDQLTFLSELLKHFEKASWDHPECEEAVAKRTRAWNEFKTCSSIRLDKFFEDVNIQMNQLTLAENKAIKEFIEKQPMPVWKNGPQFFLSEFEKKWVIGTEELKLGQHLPLSVLNTNSVLIDDVVEYRRGCYELCNKEGRVTFSSGLCIYALKMSEKVQKRKKN
jgi:hypothetical protein